MLGEVGLSNVVEASVRGFKPDDIDPATDESAVVDSKHLGAGQAGKTYLLTTKTGAELVFKPELDSRIGLENLRIGSGAYKFAQKTANLNLATQDTAKAFGCEDLVVKYSVGSHDGQFGVFMEKAKGFTGEDFWRREKTKGDGFVPDGLKDKITDEETRLNIQGQIAQKLNKLQWLDLITGQGDRHWNNYFVCIEKNVTTNTFDVTVKAIDNDASFTARQVGLQKYALDKDTAAKFLAELKKECIALYGAEAGQKEYDNRVSKDLAIKDNGDGTVTVDLAKAKSPEVKMALNQILGVQSIAIPEEIDKEFYDKLMEMDKDPSKKQDYLNSLAPRISKEALTATESRLNEAIEHAKKLDKEGKVFGNDDWKDKERLSKMPMINRSVEIVNSDGKTVVADRKMGVNKKGRNFVVQYLTNSCPSYYKRDNLQYMFS